MSSDADKVSVLTLLDLSAAFDTIDHSVLCSRLHQHFGIKYTVLSCFRSYLTDRSFAVRTNGASSDNHLLNHGVPQGSVLGPILFTLYVLPLASVIESHDINHHMYADDTQLYQAASIDDLPSLVNTIESCCSDVKSWMLSNGLKLNEDKTEVLVCSTNAKLHTIDMPFVTIDDTTVPVSKSAKNLGVHLDPTLSMDQQISSMVRIMNFELRRISKMKPFLSQTSLKSVVSSLILSRLDYCNSLLAGLPDWKINKLQRVQNNATRLVLGKQTIFDSPTEMLITLHWLPVKARILYKIALFCYKSAVEKTAPPYIQELLPIHTPNRSLRSNDSNLLEIPCTRLKFSGDRAFTKIGPSTWNSLPKELRHASSIATFKKPLKTYLFYEYLL